MMKCFIEYTEECEFPIENLPYGVFSTGTNPKRRIGVAIGDQILDLSEISHLFSGPILKNHNDVFKQSTLNRFMALDYHAWQEARATLQSLLSTSNKTLQNDAALRKKAFIMQSQATMHLPATIGDYTDFCCSFQHAINVCSILSGQPKDKSLITNALRLPLGYHGKASSVVTSGTPLIRPNGQHLDDNRQPTCGPCRKMDYEMEVGFFVGGSPTKLGEPVNVHKAHERIFGFVLLNDWSARDILEWEFRPLGPFTGKSMATVISPWIVTPFALEPFKVPNYSHETKPFDYLAHDDCYNFDVELQVQIIPEQSKMPTTVTKTNLKYINWTFKQQLAHQTITGANVNPADLIGGGTISGTADSSWGSMIEITSDGKKPITLADGTVRGYVNDGDSVVMRGTCKGDGFKIGFGMCESKVLPALKL